MPAAAHVAPPPRPWGWRDGRWIVAGLLLVHLTLFFQLSPRLEVVQVAHRWGVYTIQPDFSDLYFIAAASATHHAGGDPYVANTFDPLQRAYNYPPVWLYFWSAPPTAAGIGLQAAGLGLFGAGAFLLYLGAICWRRGLLFGALVCSPPVVLAAQRANADILMLGLAAAALLFLRRERRAAGYGLLVAATWLKLYPLATLAVLLREPRARLGRLGPLVFAAAALCFAVYAGYLGRIFANTPSGGLHSYGAPVAAFWLSFFLPAYGWQVDRTLLSHLFSLLAVLTGCFALRGSWQQPAFLPDRFRAGELDGLRTGAAVYVSTFLLGVSFDYRLLFLLLCVPALISLAVPAAPGRAWGRAALVFVFATMWPNGLFWKPLLIVKEAGSWALFFTLTVLLVRTLPAGWKEKSPPAGNAGTAAQ